jgi:hypothetical protein
VSTGSPIVVDVVNDEKHLSNRRRIPIIANHKATLLNHEQLDDNRRTTHCYLPLFRIVNGSKVDKSSSDSRAALQATSVFPHLPLCFWNASFTTSQVARSYLPATSLEHTNNGRLSKSNTLIAFERFIFRL